MTDLLPLDLDELRQFVSLAAHGAADRPVGTHEWTCAITLLAEGIERSLPSPVEGGEEGNSPSVADIAMRGTTASHPEAQHSAGGCAADHAKYLGKCPYCHTALNLTMERR